MSTNYLTNIAIVGAGGNVGTFVTRALIEQGKHKVTALTRPDSKSTLPEGLHDIKKVDYSSKTSLIEALKGQDVLIITMGVTAGNQQTHDLIDAAVEAGIKYIVPNEWGSDVTVEALARDTMLGVGQAETREYINKAGAHWMPVICSFWYEFSLSGTEIRYGFDFKDKSVTFYDDGSTKILTTTWHQVGRAVAKVLALPVEAEHSSGLSIKDFADRGIFISSFKVSQRDMLDSVLRVTGDKESDWTIKHEGSKERYQRGQELFQQGDMMGFGLLLYARVFYPSGDADHSAKLDNERLGLPVEDLDEATKVAIEMAAKESS